MLRAATLAVVLGAAAGTAEAASVCRPTALGAVECVGPAVRPAPRPVFREPADGSPLPPAEPRRATRLVPARETNRLGTTLTDVPGRCRSDRLGNLSCR